MKFSTLSNAMVAAVLTLSTSLLAADARPEEIRLQQQLQQRQQQQQQRQQIRGTEGVSCDASSTNTTYALLQVAAAGSGILGSATNNDPIVSTTDTGTQVDYSTTPATITLSGTNGTNYCNSYYNGTSWVTDTNYSGNTIDVTYFLLSDSSNNVASRFPAGFGEVVTSGNPIQAPGMWWNTVLQLYNSGTDTHNTATCTDANGAFYWKVELCNN